MEADLQCVGRNNLQLDRYDCGTTNDGMNTDLGEEEKI